MGDADCRCGNYSEESLLPLLRRDWDVRVLDAWRSAVVAPRKRAYEFDEHGRLWICEWHPLARMGQVRDQYDGTPDAARHAAALAVSPSLPEAVRAELGECP
jgi:hypothetical protein